jgi:hypothetical protein
MVVLNKHVIENNAPLRDTMLEQIIFLANDLNLVLFSDKDIDLTFV